MQALILLSPPRSFSSVVCAALGQHPELYGLPELNAFVADTVEGWHAFHAGASRPQGAHGLVRVLAQVNHGRQAVDTIERAWQWLAERRSWTMERVLGYLSEAVSPLVMVDKSPTTVMSLEHLERLHATLPGACFLHLSRHPVSSHRSLADLQGRRARLPEQATPWVEPYRLWYRTHRNILDFASVLPEGQCLHLQGERLLGDPDLYLVQVARWLGLRTDPQALSAMKHPERSVYACYGPGNARFGNDPKFLASPKLRAGRFRNEPLEASRSYRSLPRELAEEVREMTGRLGYR